MGAGRAASLVRRSLVCLAVAGLLVLSGCKAPAESPSPSPTATESAGADPGVRLESAVPDDWAYLNPPSASEFVEFLERSYSELTQEDVVLLWSADSREHEPPESMTIPGRGTLKVWFGCKEGSVLGVSAMRDETREFWVMSDTCDDPGRYSGEKPFTEKMDTTVIVDDTGDTEYVIAAYFLPEDDPTI